MSHVFELNRFLQLMGSHFRKNLKTYLISCVVFAGVTIGLFVLVVSSYREEAIVAGKQFFVYLIVIYGGLFVFTVGVFQPFQRPREGPFQLMLPASGFEKFLLGWLVSLVGYTICANVVFFVIRYAVLQYYAAQGYEVSGFLDYDRLLFQQDGISMAWVLAMVYVFLHAFALYGSLMFRKMAVLKTALALLIVVLAYWVVNGMLYRSLFQLDIQQTPLLPLMPLFLQGDDMVYRVNIPDWPYWLLALSIAIMGLLWVASYHKLREKEG